MDTVSLTAVVSYPGVPNRRRGEKEHLVHNVVRMRLISEKVPVRYRPNVANELFGFGVARDFPVT